MTSTVNGSFVGWDSQAAPSPHGPYQNTTNSNLYSLVVDDSGATTVDVGRMFVSTNSGTAWSELDSANAVQIGFANAGTGVSPNVAACFASNTVQVAYWGTNNSIHVKPFDTVNGTWGTDTSGGPNVLPAPHGFFVVKRSTDVVVTYNEHHIVSGTDTAQGNVVVTTAGTWNAAQAMPLSSATGNCLIFGAILGASDRVHIWSEDAGAHGEGTDTAIPVYHTSYKSANTFGVNAKIGTNVSPPNGGVYQTHPWYDGTNIMAGVIDATTFNVRVLAATEAENPGSWSDNDLAQALGFSDGQSVIAFIVDTASHVVFNFSTNQLREHDNSGGGWNAGSSIYTAPGDVQTLSIQPNFGGIGVLFSESDSGIFPLRTMYLLTTNTGGGGVRGQVWTPLNITY